MVLFGISVVNLQAQRNLDTGGEIVTDPLGFEMIYVPSGTVQMGIDVDAFSDMVTTGIFSNFGGVNLISLEEDSGVFETYETTLHGFWIDRYELTVNQYERISQRCVEINNCSNSNLPQLLAWDEAVRFCAGRGARLPTEQEWEYAASGPDNLIFPWGDELTTELLDYQTYIGFDLYDVGSRPLNVSWIGVFDMAGNAEEWTDDLFQPYNSRDALAFTRWYVSNSEFWRVLRGGEAVDSFLQKTTYSRQGGFYGPAGVRCARFTRPNDG
jgi:formylglycine-generating enzyme required for sulfatase activity